MTDNGLNINDFFDEALNEGRGSERVTSNARGNGKNVNKKSNGNSGKGATATTLGSHSKSKLSRKQRKQQAAANKQQSEEVKEEEPIKEAPKEDTEPKEETKPETPPQEDQPEEKYHADGEEESGELTQEEKDARKKTEEADKEKDSLQGDGELSDADIDDETRMSAATEIATKRINFFNEQLADVYRAVGNIVAHKTMVFPLFEGSIVPKEDVEKLDKSLADKKKQEDEAGDGDSIESRSEEPEQLGTGESLKFSKDFGSMLNEVGDSLYEAELEKQNAEQPKQKKVVMNLKYSTKWPSNKFTSKLDTLAKNMNVDEYSNLTNIGRLCAVTSALISKYRELYENLPKVNEYIKMDKIELDGESINMNINNTVMKVMFQVFKGTNGERAIRVLNDFATKNIGSITSNTSLQKIIDTLPNQINDKLAVAFNNGGEFRVTINEGTPAWKLWNQPAFREAWFVIDNIKDIEKQEKEAEKKAKEQENNKEEKKPEQNNQEQNKPAEGEKPNEANDAQQNSK